MNIEWVIIVLVEVHLIKRHVEGLRCELVERVLMCLRGWHPSALVGVNLCGLVAFICLLVRLAPHTTRGLAFQRSGRLASLRIQERLRLWNAFLL